MFPFRLSNSKSDCRVLYFLGLEELLLEMCDLVAAYKTNISGQRVPIYLFCKQLLDDFKETRGYRKLKEEALCPTLWRTRFGRVYGRVVRHYGMNVY